MIVSRRKLIGLSAAGASGYLLKETPGPGVVEAIRAVHAGRRPAHDVSCAARRPTQ